MNLAKLLVQLTGTLESPPSLHRRIMRQNNCNIAAARFWNCKGESDCIVWHAAPIHYPCKMARLRFFAPVFAATVVFVYLCISECFEDFVLGRETRSAAAHDVVATIAGKSSYKDLECGAVVS